MKGVLLVNMGSPSTEEEMKTFLQKMFSDHAIIPLPYILRKLIAFIISNSRYKGSWKKYLLIGGSPLKVSDNSLATNLGNALGKDYIVRNAFSYSKPSIEDVIKQLYDKGVRKLQVLPLYPHYSLTTIGSVIHDVNKIAKDYKELEIKFTERFYRNKNFIEYWTSLIKEVVNKNNLTNPLLFFSVHAIPEINVRKGDTYIDEINESAKMIAEASGLEYKLAFQSKIGRVKWAEPSTKDLLSRLHSTDELENRTILMVPVSFISENLETLYDLDMDIIPYAKNELSINSILRVHIPLQNNLMIEALKELI